MTGSTVMPLLRGARSQTDNIQRQERKHTFINACINTDCRAVLMFSAGDGLSRTVRHVECNMYRPVMSAMCFLNAYPRELPVSSDSAIFCDGTSSDRLPLTTRQVCPPVESLSPVMFCMLWRKLAFKSLLKRSKK